MGIFVRKQLRNKLRSRVNLWFVFPTGPYCWLTAGQRFHLASEWNHKLRDQKVPDVQRPTFLNALQHAHDPPCADVTSEPSSLRQYALLSLPRLASAEEELSKFTSQAERVFSRRREGKILEHYWETLERRALLTMEWSLIGFTHKKWQDQLRSDWCLPYCSHGASARRRKRKVGLLWNGLLYKVKPQSLRQFVGE